MDLTQFQLTNLPQIIFGEGAINSLPDCILKYGSTILIVTGAKSFCDSTAWVDLQTTFKKLKIEYTLFHVIDEPSTQLIDQTVSKYKSRNIQVVVGIGGGSVLDAAKAIAGLLPFGNSVLDHLEGIGPGIAYTGPSLPFIALPTTAGAGSEATKNAVISERGENGYKKSFRHETLVPKIAIVDPALLKNCSALQIAANGMDAFTQLIESYVSKRANDFTDALALDGIKSVITGFKYAWNGGDSEEAIYGRNKMAYASLISGITLAQVGLGSVHGLASPLGAFFPIPHGVVCGTLLAEATQVNIAAMKSREPDNIALNKYATIGKLLSKKTGLDNESALNDLVQILYDWTDLFKLPQLSKYNITKNDFEKIISDSRGSSMQTNPIVLKDSEIELILKNRL